MTSTGLGREEQSDIGMEGLCVGGTPSLQLGLSFSLIVAHMVRECDRTNVLESKESVVLLLTGTDEKVKSNSTEHRGQF